MKVIQQLVEHFRGRGALSPEELARLRQKGFLPPPEEPQEEEWNVPQEPEDPLDETEELQGDRPDKRRKKGPRPCIRRWWEEQVRRLQEGRK
jgi:hypothetical protein